MLLRPPKWNAKTAKTAKKLLALRSSCPLRSWLAPTIVVLTVGAASAENWPQWRGPNRDGVSAETGLLKEWPGGVPKLLWQVDRVGVGFSSLSVRGGRLYTQGDLNGVEHVICLSGDDGRTWSTATLAEAPPSFGTRRTEPTLLVFVQ